MGRKQNILNKSMSDVLADYTSSFLIGYGGKEPRDISKAEMDELDRKCFEEMNQAIGEGICHFWIGLFKEYMGLSFEDITVCMAEGLSIAAEERELCNIIKRKNTSMSVASLILSTRIMQQKFDVIYDLLREEEL